MKQLILTLSILLFGCGTTEPEYKKIDTVKENSDMSDNAGIESMPDKIINLVDVPSDSLSIGYSDDENSILLEDANNQNYDVQRSLNKILNSDDPRKLVYLVHPTKKMLVYCYHNLESECYIEGLHKNMFFKYDISQVEGQNMGKLTFHTHNIESSKTTPIKWMTVEDDYVMVLMTSKIMLNSQQHTLHEPLVINYEKGMMVR